MKACDLKKENDDLKQINCELNRALKQERIQHEHYKNQLQQQMQDLASKVNKIENGCGKEVTLRIKALRDEIVSTSNQKFNTSYKECNIETMVD